jgi:hypothetical protein
VKISFLSFFPDTRFHLEFTVHICRTIYRNRGNPKSDHYFSNDKLFFKFDHYSDLRINLIDPVLKKSNPNINDESYLDFWQWGMVRGVNGLGQGWIRSSLLLFFLSEPNSIRLYSDKKFLTHILKIQRVNKCCTSQWLSSSFKN